MKALYLEHDITVSTHEIDFAGHVSNIVYLRWLEDMRLKMFDIYCPLQNFMALGQTPVLLSSEIRYHKPIRLFEKPRGKMWVSELTMTTLTIEAEIYLGDVQTTSAKHVGVFVDIAKMRPIRVPKLFLETIYKYNENSSQQN